METPSVFGALEWQVSKVRRAINQYEQREGEEQGKGLALLLHATEDLDKVVLEYVEALVHAQEGKNGG